MASVGAEYEEQIQDWMKSFETLPEARKDNLMRWFATQKVIIDNTGLTPEQWFGYIEWAMNNPLDYSFIMDFPETEESKAAMAEGSAERDARKFVGGNVPTKAATDGPGMQDKAQSERKVERELFDRFMKERLGGGRR